MNLVFTNNFLDPVIDAVAMHFNKLPADDLLANYYKRVHEYTIDKRASYLDLEFEDKRRNIFKSIDAELDFNPGKDMYVTVGNHYSVVEHYPLANIILADYNPSLIFAKFANNKSHFKQWSVVDYVWAYCRLKQWLDGRGIKYIRLRLDLELPTLTNRAALLLVDKMNEQIYTEEYGSWDESGKVEAFELLGYDKISSSDAVGFFK